MPIETPREAPRLHAGFWRRLSAALLDLIVAYLIAIPLLVLAAGFVGPETAQRFLFPAIVLYVLLYLWAGARRATPGKSVFRIVVSTREGGKPSMLQALGRSVVLVATLGLGLVLAAFTPRKQALHDLAAGTLVVRRGATPEEIRDGGGTMRLGPAIALPIVAVLVLPVAGVMFMGNIRNEYTQRARLADVVSAVKPLQRRVEEARASGTALPVGAARIETRNAISARFAENGVIVVDVADRIAPGGRLSYAHDGTRWTCRARDIPPGYLPRDCRD